MKQKRARRKRAWAPRLRGAGLPVRALHDAHLTALARDAKSSAAALQRNPSRETYAVALRAAQAMRTAFVRDVETQPDALRRISALEPSRRAARQLLEDAGASLQ